MSMSSTAPGATSDTIDAIATVITQSYFQGAFNALDTAAMARGFHPDFAILGAEGEHMDRYALGTWLAAIEARKAQPGFDSASVRRDCKIISIDATANVGAAKVEIYKDGALLYTDYLSLIRFGAQWKIASKVYAEHAN
ncbi:MAG: nuclear transport factor 2 family protein [Pseudomonadota bacterium]